MGVYNISIKTVQHTFGIANSTQSGTLTQNERSNTNETD